MAAIRLDRVSCGFGGVLAVNDVSLEIQDKEVVTVVGPSGCGKSTLLRIIAGLQHQSSGTVSIDGEDVSGVPTRSRNIAMVFQSYALYPHMTCYENLALGLRLRNLPANEIRQRVSETARTLEIEDLLEKKPRELSGGQRQRVAVGRALIREPRVFLFDEPLSNLDAQLRERVRHELKELFAKIRATVVYVTHDQVEALTLADRVVVLNKGVIQQVGTPEALYERPANRFVASFIGSPSMNLFDATIDRGCFQLGPRGIETMLDYSGDGIVGIRPEAIHLNGGIPGTISWIENLGLHYLVGIRIGSITLTALASERPAAESISISVDVRNVHLFEKHSGSSIDRYRTDRTRCS